MDSSKKILLTTIGIAMLIVLVSGVTFAFFNYTRTGSSNIIRVGRISFSTNQTETINLINVFPISSTDAETDTTNTDEAVVTIEGDTTFSGGIEYLVTVVDVNNSIGSQTSAKKIPISLLVTANNGLGTNDDDYMINRGSSTSLYKVLSDGTLENNGRILVGYIAKGAEGINGEITIKAFIDKDKILISDTYDGTESNNMGTTNSQAEGKTVLTTEEWNLLQTNGVSFKIKVEANEGIWVDAIGTSLYHIIENQNPSLDNVNSTYVQNVSTDGLDARVAFLNNVDDQVKAQRLSAGINFYDYSGTKNGNGIYIRKGTENDLYPIMYYRGEVNNNLVFAGFCWKIVRTTETGGIKLVYNGIQDSKGTCLSSTASNENRMMEETVISKSNEYSFKFNGDENDNNDFSLAYVGYMYGAAYDTKVKRLDDGTQSIMFGSGFVYENGVYTLTGTDYGISSSRRYTFLNSTGVCEESNCGKIYYVAYISTSFYNSYADVMYYEITNGDGIEEVLAKMLENTNDSNVKVILDDWYKNHMLQYSDILEDTVWCNDRSIYDLGCFDSHSNEGSISDYLLFDAYDRTVNKHTPKLSCTNKNDSFTVNDKERGNGALTYPIGLLTYDEIRLAGIGDTSSLLDSDEGYNYSYLFNGLDNWTMTPAMFSNGAQSMFFLTYYYLDMTINCGGSCEKNAIRPAISLKHEIMVTKDGDGTIGNPYKVVTEFETSSEVSSETSSEVSSEA